MIFTYKCAKPGHSASHATLVLSPFERGSPQRPPPPPAQSKTTIYSKQTTHQTKPAYTRSITLTAYKAKSNSTYQKHHPQPNTPEPPKKKPPKKKTPQTQPQEPAPATLWWAAREALRLYNPERVNSNNSPLLPDPPLPKHQHPTTIPRSNLLPSATTGDVNYPRSAPSPNPPLSQAIPIDTKRTPPRPTPAIPQHQTRSAAILDGPLHPTAQHPTAERQVDIDKATPAEPSGSNPRTNQHLAPKTFHQWSNKARSPLFDLPVHNGARICRHNS